MKRRFSLFAGLLAFVFVYFFAGKLGLSLAFINASATAVWPPTGLALVAVLLGGYRVWPGIFLAAFLVNLTTAGSLLTSIGIATGNTLEALAGAWLVNRYARGRNAFDHTQTLFKFVTLAAVLSTTVSATLGLTSLCLGGYASWSRYGSVWLTWWIGDLVSDIIVAPLLLIWSARPYPRWKSSQIPEALVLAGALFLAGHVVFGGWFTPRGRIYAIEYLAIPPLLWAAWRFGRRGASAAALGMSAMAIAGTLQGFGPFILKDHNESLLLLQTFMATSTLTALILASVVRERKQAEQALHEAQEQLRNHAAGLERRVVERTEALQQTVNSLEGFCYSIAHDLRSPLRSINGFTRILLEEYVPAPDKAGPDYGRLIIEASEKMDRLIGGLLEFGRLSSAELRLGPVDTDGIVRRTVERFKRERFNNGLVVEVQGPLPPVLANALILEQVTDNLMENAIKFVRPGVPPRIKVRVENSGGRVRIWIEDNGIGIDPEYHEVIFGVFQRLHPDQAYPGTGIGLAIVKKGVERMGGRVGVESKPDQGSRFWFELKAA